MSSIVDQDEQNLVKWRCGLYEEGNVLADICDGHKKILGKGFALRFLSKNICLWGSHIGSRRNSSKPRRISLANSQLLFESQFRILIPVDGLICQKCLFDFQKKLNDARPLEPSAPPMDAEDSQSQPLPSQASSYAPP